MHKREPMAPIFVLPSSLLIYNTLNYIYIIIIINLNNIKMKNVKSNYDLVLEIIESYEDQEILNDFKKEFKKGKNISKKEYMEFCVNYVDDMSEGYYINLNWLYIESGGDESVYDEVEEYDEDGDLIL
jgi:hypothetical protein